MIYFPVEIAIAFTGVVHFSNNIFNYKKNKIKFGRLDSLGIAVGVQNIKGDPKMALSLAGFDLDVPIFDADGSMLQQLKPSLT